MTLRLEERTLRVDTVLGEGETQVVARGSVSLPDSRPDIERALRVRAVPVVRSCEALDGRVVIEGALDLGALYTTLAEQPAPAVDEEDPYAAEAGSLVYERLHGDEWPEAISFTETLDVPGAVAGAAVDAALRVEAIEFDLASDRRTLNVDVVVFANATATETTTATAAVGAAGTADVVASDQPLAIRSVLGRASVKASADGTLPLPEGSANVEVVWTALTPEVTAASVGEGEVVVAGRLRGDVVYVTGSGQEPFRLGVVDELGFEAHVRLDGVTPGPERRAYVDATVGPGKWRLGEDEGGGAALEGHVTVRLHVRVEQNERARVITHLAGGEGDVEVAARTNPVALVETVGRADAGSAVSESLEIGPDQLPIERLLAGEAAVRVNDVHVLGDKVVVEGQVDVNALYVGRGGPGEGDVPQLASWPGGLSFEAEVPIDGAEPGMQRQVVVRIDDVTFDLRNRETVDVDVRLRADALVSRSVNTDVVVEAVVVPPAPADPPSYTFLVVQKGDTLWKLARQYRTDEFAIMAANPTLDAEAGLVPGEKLCIPRVRAAVPAAS